MNHQEAAETIKDAQTHASPDFYRMQFSSTVALGLQDQPMQILTDVIAHGSTEAKALLQEALQCGYVKTVENNGYTYYDVVDVENSGAPFYFRSHIAMQIAYPEVYSKYFGGEYVWVFDDHRMRALCELCVSCLTDKRHPSDYYGEHEVPEPGVKVAPTKSKLNVGHAAWVIACQEYKKALSASWLNYQTEEGRYKDAKSDAKVERDCALDKLRAEMSKVSSHYKNKLEPIAESALNARLYHSELRAQGKPQRGDFE